MKIIKIGMSLLMVSSLFAAENIVDKTHEKVVNSLDNNVEVLPESMQGIAKGAINVIDKDGKNLNFVLKLTNIGYRTDIINMGSMDADTKDNNYLLATAGIMFLPNTWKIELSYTGQIGKNTFYENHNTDSASSYDVDDGEEDMKFIDFYTKPISTIYGNFGFGFRSMEQTEEMYAFYNKIVDNPNVNIDTARHTVNNDYYYFTYNVPGKNRWYSGFGLSYTIGTTNQSGVSSDGNSIVLSPDTEFTKIDVGINKTLDEVGTGLSFKTLTFGTRADESKYHNYDNGLDESYTRDFTTLEGDIIYMFKPRKNKKIYTSIKIARNINDYVEYEEIKVELGVIF